MPYFYTDKWNISYEIRFREDNHSRPHVHVHYNNKEASIALDNLDVLAGYLPSKALKRSRNYIKENKDDLLEKWNDAKNGINFMKKD